MRKRETMNPLLVPMDTLVDYRAITPEHVEPAITQLLEKARAAVDAAANPDLAPTWQAVIAPLDEATDPLWRAWTVIGHLKSVVSTAQLRAAFNQMLGPVTEFSTWVGLHEGLYRQFKRLRDNPDFTTWSAARQRVIELALRDFRLSGVALAGDQRERLDR